MDPDKDLYSKLETAHTTRLAIIAAGAQDDPVSVQFRHVDLDENPLYDAISYVWGSQNDKETIVCNGRKVEVTHNLLWALRRVRRPDNEVFVWADAICINQTDLDERRSQVALMHRIYGQAERVLVCLGAYSLEGAENVESIVRDALQSGVRAHASERDVVAKANGTLVGDQRWHDVSRVLSHPWFSRTWVIQEVGLAREAIVLLGTAVQFRYRDFMDVAHRAARTSLGSKYNIGILFIHTEWSDWSSAKHTSYSFLDLLEHASTLDCWDPRDRIYAFLGHRLARKADTGEPLFTIDYARPHMAVYQEVMSLLLRQHGTRALSAIRHDEASITEEWPSWVARWDIGYETNNLRHLAWAWLLPDGASNADSISPDGNVVRLQGIQLDRIEASFRLNFVDMEVGLVLQDSTSGTFHRLESFYRNHVLAKEKEEDSFLSAILAGSMHLLRSEQSSVLKAGGPVSCSFLRKVLSGQQSGSRLGSDLEREAAHRYWSACVFAGEGRSLYVTERGHFGLGPCIAAPGDICYVLADAQVLFVLRRRDAAQGGGLRIVGESYLHGFMQGEVAEGLRRGELATEQIMLV